jgi:hypothetical protein
VGRLLTIDSRIREVYANPVGRDLIKKILLQKVHPRMVSKVDPDPKFRSIDDLRNIEGTLFFLDKG